MAARAGLLRAGPRGPARRQRRVRPPGRRRLAGFRHLAALHDPGPPASVHRLAIRAYQGGLRLVSCLAVNNELMGSRIDPDAAHRRSSAVELQVKAAKEMVAWVDRQAAARGRAGCRSLIRPRRRADIIRANKLAVVLGMEVDSLGNWRRLEDLQDLSQGQHRAGTRADRRGAGLAARAGHPPDHADPPDRQCLRRHGDLHAPARGANVFVTGRHYEVEDAGTPVSATGWTTTARIPSIRWSER